MTAYRNDQARMDSEAANRAIDREARNEQVNVWIEALGFVALGVGFVAALLHFVQSGLFGWLK